MKCIPISFLVFILFSIAHIGFSKDSGKKNQKQANRYFKAGEFEKAIIEYKAADSISEFKLDNNYKIGLSYFYLFQKDKAVEYFSIVEKLQGKNADPYLYYLLGNCYHYTMNLDKSIQYYLRYTNEYKEDAIAARELELCKNAKEIIKDSIKLFIQNCGSDINTKFAEYSPLVDKNESYLFYNGFRPLAGSRELKPYTLKSYIINQPGEFGFRKTSKLKGLQDVLIVSGMKELNVLFLYKETQPDKKMPYQSDIYSTTHIPSFDKNVDEEGRWSPIQLVKGINSNAEETSLAVSADGKKLIVSSTRTGGLGGTDLYISRLQTDSTWGKVENMGNVVNSAFDEHSPCFSFDGNTVWFSSDGHYSMGGFDIFETKFDPIKKEWSKPKNVGYPINSTANDMNLYWLKEGVTGYIASDRMGTLGDLDIYKFSKEDFRSRDYYVNLLVLDDSSKKYTQSQVDVIKNSTKENVISFETSKIGTRSSFMLTKGFEYTVTVSNPHYFKKSEPIYLPISNDEKIKKMDIFIHYNSNAVVVPASKNDEEEDDETNLEKTPLLNNDSSEKKSGTD